MSKRLSKSEREQIIFNHLKGKETPGYEVIEQSNGKFTVRTIKEEPKIEIEEEENENEPENEPEIEEEENPEPESIIQTRTPNRTKQNARELLKQLTQLLEENDFDNEPYQGQFIEKRYKPGPQSWKRRKLVL